LNAYSHSLNLKTCCCTKCAEFGYIKSKGRFAPKAAFENSGTVNLNTKRLVSLFQVGREHIFDPFHECADSARQVAPMCYDEGHGEGPATKIGYDLHKRSTL
jgi:hypothetical protein